MWPDGYLEQQRSHSVMSTLFYPLCWTSETSTESCGMQTVIGNFLKMAICKQSSNEALGWKASVGGDSLSPVSHNHRAMNASHIPRASLLWESCFLDTEPIPLHGVSHARPSYGVCFEQAVSERQISPFKLLIAFCINVCFDAVQIGHNSCLPEHFSKAENREQMKGLPNSQMYEMTGKNPSRFSNFMKCFVIMTKSAPRDMQREAVILCVWSQSGENRCHNKMSRTTGHLLIKWMQLPYVKLITNYHFQNLKTWPSFKYRADTSKMFLWNMNQFKPSKMVQLGQ